MKKYLALGLLSLWGAVSFAQDALKPEIIPDATARKMSTDGKWVACYGMSLVVYNVENQNNYVYNECSLGIGNSLAIDGTLVGSQGDLAVFMKDGKITYPEVIVDNGFGAFNAITSDGTRVTGFVKNPVFMEDDSLEEYEDNITVNIPFWADVTPDGKIEKINLLPYPEKDFLGSAPMYVTGEWISEDGKTILGKMTDSYGRFEDPVVFLEDENGEWSCTTPTKPFFNPKDIKIPENPWLNYPKEPVYKDYMTGLKYQAYLEALNKYLFEGGPEVDPFDYMTEEAAQKYIEDYKAYENYFYDHKDEIDAYEEAYRELLASSVYFRESALDPSGTIFVTTAVNYDDEGKDIPSRVITFNAQTGDYKEFESQYSDLKIHQVLTDGTVLAYTGLFTYDALQGYILLPGESEFMPFSDYLAVINPEYAQWLEEYFPLGEGIISASQDLTVFAGGVDILSMDDPSLAGDSTILSYVLPAVQPSGVESIADSFDDDFYRIYNMTGIKVLETKDKSELNNLGKGIYIINGKKVMIGK